MNGMARGDRFRVEHSTRVLRSATRRKHRRGAAQWADPLAQMPRTPAFAAGAIRTQAGSYAPAFIGAGALCVMAALAVLPIARTPTHGDARLGLLLARRLAESG